LEHGHVHSRAWMNAPSATHPSPLRNHAAPSPRNNGALSSLKPNHAIRTAESLDDAPDHVSLAMSPAIRARRLHHRMVHGRAYPVAAVLDVRVKDGRTEYLLAWEGYPDFFNSWEPAAGVMQACTGLVSDFERRQREEEGASDGEDSSSRGSSTELGEEEGGAEGRDDARNITALSSPQSPHPEGHPPPVSDEPALTLPQFHKHPHGVWGETNEELGETSTVAQMNGASDAHHEEDDGEEEDEELAQLHHAHLQRQRSGEPRAGDSARPLLTQPQPRAALAS